MSQKFLMQSIDIKGFKSFNAEGQKLELGDLTVLIGANGAGKSNLISFFRMITNMMNDSLHKYIGINGGADSLLYLGAKKTAQIESQFKFSFNNSVQNYRFILSYAAGDTLFISEEGSDWQSETGIRISEMTKALGKKETALSKLVNKENTKFLAVNNLLKCFQVYHFHDTTNASPMRKNSYLNDNKNLKSDGGNLAAILYAQKNSDRWNNYYKRIVEHIRYVLPEFEDFVLEPDIYSGKNIILNWRAKYSDHLFGPHQLSDGSLRFIALMTLLLRPKELLPPIIIIDEPELGLHPSAISILANVINFVKSETQIIIATQSPNFVDEFEPSEIVVVEKNRIENCTKLRRLDINSLKEWLEEYSLSELWEKNVLGGKP